MRSTLLLVLLAACATRGGPAGGGEPVPPPAPATTFAPGGEPAARYADPGAAAARDPLVGEIAGAVVRATGRLGHPQPALDARLSAVADDLARLPPADGGPPSDAVQFALAFHGLVEPSPYLLIYDLKDGDAGGMDAQLDGDLPEVLAGARFLHLGVGAAPAAPGVTTVVIALQEGSVTLEPLPRELPRGGRARLRGRVLAPYRTPEVYITGPDGLVAEAPVVRDGDDGFRADVVCPAEDGRLKVEVMAEDRADNPTVLANFPVFCGAPAPRVIEIASRAAIPRDAAEVEREMLRLANIDRARAGLAPLAWNEKAAAIARAHSTEMRDRKYVAHVSPVTGTLADRARAGGLGTPLLLENLARAQSAAEAHFGLMDSPGHRANLLNPKATHLGVGVALPGDGSGDRDLYITELFFRVTPRQEPAALRQAAVTALAAARGGAHVAQLIEDEDLTFVAQAYARGLAQGRDREGLGRAADMGLDRLNGRYGAVVSVIAVVGDPADAVRDAVIDARVRAFGLGIAQGTHPEIGEGAIYIVMMLGRGR